MWSKIAEIVSSPKIETHGTWWRGNNLARVIRVDWMRWKEAGSEMERPHRGDSGLFK